MRRLDGSSLPLVLLLLGALRCGSGDTQPQEGDLPPGSDLVSQDLSVEESASDLEPADTAEADGEPAGLCTLAADENDPDFVAALGCRADYLAVASPPLVASIPGALSAKTVLDRLDENRLYFQNSRRYPIHWNFASTHLSGNGLPLVPPLSQFNQTEYYTPDRRFVLGALNYYEGPRVWAYEIAPYDTADAAMIELAFRAIKARLWVGDSLAFHPTSDSVSAVARSLPADIPVVTTEELFAGIDYQPLNLAVAMGQLRFFSKDDLETRYLGFRDIAVLQVIPNDLSVCSGTITAQFQTPLSHINVLAQNRGSPNMGLRGAFENTDLRALEGRWVQLQVAADSYTIVEVTREEADAWWEAHRPPVVVVPKADLSVTTLTDIEELLKVDELGLEEALAKAIPAFGGKASHFGAFPHITTYPIPYPKAFVVPIFYYDQFMKENGFDSRINQLLSDPQFLEDPATREAELQALRDAIESAPLNADFEAALAAKLEADFPGVRMKFRSSTNCEDLNGFTGAGLYQSAVGDPDDPTRPYGRAVKKVWASVWRFRAFEERAYRGISHREVGMAVLIHRSFPAEASNGVAITANIFDTQGLEPGYYINAQAGDTSVVLPPEGVTSDQFLYHFDMPGQPMVFLAHSNLVAPGQTVLTRAQTAELGKALEAIHAYFDPVYGPNKPDHFYAMDVEFKFDTDLDDPNGAPKLVIKQARPYPGRGE
jgi:hypothetical protein